MPKDVNVVETTNANKVFDIPVQLQPGQVNTLSFSQDSISEMRELPQGELEIVFRDGSKVVVENFDELVNSAQSCGRDTIIQLSDNTIIYPEELAGQLAKGPVNFETAADEAGVALLSAPKAGQVVERNIESGHEYKLGFELSDTVSAAQAGQNLILTFKDGGILVLNNYFTAMNTDLPPALTLADGSAIDATALLTSCKLVEIPATAAAVAANSAATDAQTKVAAVDPAAGVEEPAQEQLASAARKGEAKAKSGVPDVEPAAGEQPIVPPNVEPAAGDAGNQLSSSSRGYGFNSSIDAATLNGANAVGPIGATQLAYGAPFVEGRLRPGEEQGTPDTAPILLGDTNAVDETNLGPNVVSGNVNANYQQNGPGSVAFNDTFSAGGSLAGGALTSHGQPVVVTLVGNTYTGVANGTTVFTLVLDPATGDYTFTQNAPLDHQDGTDQNDLITLQFGITATDGDNDTASNTLTIGVYDDAPIAANDGATVGSSPLTVTGNVTDNDYLGNDATTLVTKVVYNGTTYTVPAVGTVSIVAAYGTLTIGANGAYTYVSKNTAEGTDNFTYTIVDFDGDPSTANLSVTVTDIDTIPTINNGSHTVDETNLGPNVVSGQLTPDFKDDAPGTLKLTGFSFDGAKGGALASCGDAVTVSLVNGNYVGVDADGVTIFTLNFNETTGAYTFTQYKGLDHADPNNPDDVLNLNFVVTATDADGDTVNGTIKIAVKDDGPTADDDWNNFDTNAGTTSGNVVTGLNGGAGADDTLSKDGHNTVTKITFKGVDYPVPTSGEATVNGDYGVLKIKADGSYTYTLYTGSGSGGGAGSDGTFSESLEFPTTGDGGPKFDETSPNEGLKSDSLDISTSALGTVKVISQTAGYKNTLGLYTIGADGTIQAVQVISSNVNNLALGGTKSFGIPASGQGVGFFLVADGFTENAGYAGKDLSTGNLVFYYHYGQPDQRIGKVTDGAANLTLVYVEGGVSDVIAGQVFHTTDRDGANTLNPDGKVHTISGLADDGDSSVLRIGFEDFPQQGDKDFSDVIIDFSYKPIVQDSTSDEFIYTLTDCDGDSDTAILHLNGKDLIDDKPVIADPGSKTVDETVVASSGNDTVTGSISVNYGADTPGTVIPTGAGTFAFSGSTGATLTSNGVAVVVTLVGNQYIGKAGGTTIFTLTVNTSGSYTFVQSGQLDHADGSNPDDVITLKFGVTAKDSDDDSATATIAINVKDDAPVAVDDTATVASAPGSVSGNVTGNDKVGEDQPGYVVKQVVYNGVTYPVPGSGTVVINGAHGTLTIGKTGAYTYTGSSVGSDVFTYQIVDQDGDKATAKLTLTVNDLDTVPTAENSVKTVDETALDDSGTQTVNGNLTVDYKADGVGTTSPTTASSFSATGSVAGGSLKSHGSAVTVTLSGDTYTGKSADGRTIFTLQVKSDATYQFKLFDQLDHADATNPDDTIALNFGYKANDTDDDVATAKITINVKDDGPTAVDDTHTVASAPATVTGNVLTNDDAGADEPAPVQHVTPQGGSTVGVPSSGVATIVGAHGTLKISADGSYTYTATSVGTDVFTYKIMDFDGDKSYAKLTFTVNDLDTVPTAQNSTQTVDETALDDSGTQTVNGTLTVDYKADGVGTTSPTTASSFSSSGSVAGGSLKSHGSAVTVTLSGDTYTGKSADGRTIFTLQVKSDATYQFKLFDQLDHANASDPDDVIALNFGYKANDTDNDVATAQITINVKDDGPVAVDDSQTVSSAPGTVSGNVLTNDDAGADEPAPVQHVTPQGGSLVGVPSSGTVNITGAHGILTIAANGSYTYKATSAGTDVFTYKIMDFDGDKSYAKLTFTVNDVDTCPTIQNSKVWFDETDMANGNKSVSGTTLADFLADGPGTVKPTGTGTFVADVSLKNGKLTSDGVAVVVSIDNAANSYVGMAGARKVFELKINNDGSYTYTQFDNLDHNDGADPNDIIRLRFGVTAKDSDDDSASATIEVCVKDDAPLAVNDTNTVNNLPGTVTGNILTNDKPGADAPAPLQHVTPQGGSLVGVPSSGSVNITGAHGILTISANGQYSYKATSVGTDVFTYKIMDFDGDKSYATLTIKVDDLDTCPVVGDSAKTVDDTNLGPNVATGTVPADFKADAPGTFALSGYAASGQMSGGALKSHGSLVNVSLSGNTYTGTANGVTVFTLVLNANTGAYTFTQFKPLDHSDINNADESIVLKFTVTGKDSDNDTDTGLITITVKDDGVVADDDYNSFQVSSGGTNGNVISGANGGAGADDKLSKDGDNRITKVAFKGIEHDVPTSGEKVVNGDFGTLKIKADGSYTYTLYKGNSSQTKADFHETLKFPKTGETAPTFNESSPNEGVKSNALDITTSATGKVTILSETAGGYSNSLGLYTIGADGTIQAAQIVSKNVNETALGGSTSFDIPANGQGVGFFLIADGNTANGGYVGKDLSAGHLVFYYNYNQAGERIAKVTDTAANITLVYVDGSNEQVLSGPVYHTTDRDGSNAINPDGKVHTISGLANDGDCSVLRIGFEDLPNQGDRDFSDVIFDFTYKPTPPKATSDNFTYTLADYDGDTDKAVLHLDGQVGSTTTVAKSAVAMSVVADDHTILNSHTSEVYAQGDHADVLVMLHNANQIVIHDFDPGEGDVLDLSALVQDFDPVTDAINDFVHARTSGKDTIISVDPDGQGAPGAAQDVALLKGVTVTHVEDIVSLSHQQQNQGGLGTV